MERKTAVLITLVLLVIVSVIIAGCVNPFGGSSSSIPKTPLKPPTDDWEKDWCIRYHCADPAQKDSINCKKIDCKRYL